MSTERLHVEIILPLAGPGEVRVNGSTEAENEPLLSLAAALGPGISRLLAAHRERQAKAAA